MPLKKTSFSLFPIQYWVSDHLLWRLRVARSSYRNGVTFELKSTLEDIFGVVLRVGFELRSYLSAWSDTTYPLPFLVYLKQAYYVQFSLSRTRKLKSHPINCEHIQLAVDCCHWIRYLGNLSFHFLFWIAMKPKLLRVKIKIFIVQSTWHQALLHVIEAAWEE